MGRGAEKGRESSQATVDTDVEMAYGRANGNHIQPHGPRAPRRQELTMRPLDIQPIGGELAIKWEDGSESFVPLEKLRRACPCAGCKGEMDVLGRVYKGPDTPLTPRAFQLLRVTAVGGYAILPVWADGHNTGIFSFDYLRKVADSVS